MVCTYGSFSRDLSALESGVTIAAVPGGSLSDGQSIYLSVQIKTRGGLTLHTAPRLVTTTPTNNAIAITLTEDAIAPGDFPMELIISGAATNNVAAMVRLASWRFRDGVTIEYPGVGPVIFPGEGSARVLPKTVTLSQNAHIALSATVSNPGVLPTGANLIHGMVRGIVSTGDVLVYDSEAQVGDVPASLGHWYVHHPGFEPEGNGYYSTYFGDSTELEGGCDRVVTELNEFQAIAPPGYSFDGSLQNPAIVLFLNNGLELGGGSPMGQGDSISLQVQANGSDVSSAFAGHMVLTLLGYVNRETGELDSSVAQSAVVWQPGTSGVVLPSDLDVGFAAAYSVAIQCRKDELINSRDVSSQWLAEGLSLSVRLYFEGSLGRPSTVWYFLGDVIYDLGDRMILVPLVNGLRRLGGAATVKGFDTSRRGTYLVDDVATDTAGQQATISGALNGAIVMRPAGEALATTEAVRATVSTAPGTMAPCEWSDPVALASGNRALSFTITSPSVIRADFPDSSISGNSQGEFNVPYYRVFLQGPGPAIYELDAPVMISPTGTTLIQVLSLDDAGSASLPVQADDSFGLFGYGTLAATAIAGGDLPAGSWRVAVANHYPSPNREITSISHGPITVLGTTVADLLAQESGTAGAIPASSTAPTGANPTINPATGEANILLQTGEFPKLWLGVSATQWASAALTLFVPDPGGDDSDALAWIARFSGTYSEAELDAIVAFVTALKGDSLASSGTMWDITGFWLRATDDVADSVLNAKGTDYPITEASPGDQVFTARQGISSNYLSEALTGITPSAIASNVASMLFVYSRSTYNFDAIASAGGSIYIEGSTSGGNVEIGASFNSGGTVTLSATGENGLGGLCLMREPSAITGVINQTVMTPSGSVGSDSIASGELRFAVGDNPQYAAFAYDHSRVWTTAEAQRFNGYVEALLDALGAGVDT